MPWIVKQLMGSKKAVMTVLGAACYPLIAYLNQRWGLGLDPDHFVEALYPFIAYVLGQGLTDFGKEKAKVEANGHKPAAPKPASDEPTMPPA